MFVIGWGDFWRVRFVTVALYVVFVVIIGCHGRMHSLDFVCERLFWDDSYYKVICFRMAPPRLFSWRRFVVLLSIIA